MTTLDDLEVCFEGAVPAVIATASSDGVPNVTYLSRVRKVDAEHVALSNQFFSKTSQNLVENPRASLLLIDPWTYREYRLSLAYVRTERSGAVFDQLLHDVEAVAALSGMSKVFKLRAADIYRVTAIEAIATAWTSAGGEAPEPAISAEAQRPLVSRLAEVTARLSRCPDLDSLVATTVDSVADILGYEHCVLLLRDETGESLYTIASHGYDTEGVGSEVGLGEGLIGLSAQRCQPVRLGSVRQMRRYSTNVRREFESHGEVGPGTDVPIPGLHDAKSALVAPAMARGGLMGTIAVESTEAVAFGEADEAALMLVASVVGAAVDTFRATSGVEQPAAPPPPSAGVTPEPEVQVRFFDADGSVFFDGDYLIKGVGGRILWSLLLQHRDEGRTDFTNREVRLDQTLELPEFRDNLESRLILLKRRLDERDAPVRIEKTGRGRFRVLVSTPLSLRVG